MKPKVYLETTIISYLTARSSRDIIIAAHQELTNEWWERSMDYLLTWNCKYIANAERQHAITTVCHRNNVESPIICTPEELMGG